MKNFEPRYRLVRYGMATKVEKASRQQRTYTLHQAGLAMRWERVVVERLMLMMDNRQAEEEPQQGVPGYGQGQGCGGVEEEVEGVRSYFAVAMEDAHGAQLFAMAFTLA